MKCSTCVLVCAVILVVAILVGNFFWTVVLPANAKATENTMKAQQPYFGPTTIQGIEPYDAPMLEAWQLEFYTYQATVLRDDGIQVFVQVSSYEVKNLRVGKPGPAEGIVPWNWGGPMIFRDDTRQRWGVYPQ